MLTDPKVQVLIDRRALFVINHSGGKDSQAQMIKLLEIVPRSQLLVVHASLGEVEWEGALELAQEQARAAGVPFIVARAVWKDGTPKSFLGMVEDRHAKRPEAPSFPSHNLRQCTSDLKRGPIEREIRRYAKANGFSLIVNCMGLRAAESTPRSKLQPFTFNASNSKAGREWYDWLPIFTLSTAQVFEVIRAAGQQPHWAYAKGNERLSCVFCIYGSKTDLANGARHYPELLAKFVELEQRTNSFLHMNRKPLADLVAEGERELQALADAQRSAA
jgi:3'-phosphoadenosine 5'-phosphosulfate sulfotransferase (PAPS reductase)/FAD synthetase